MASNTLFGWDMSSEDFVHSTFQHASIFADSRTAKICFQESGRILSSLEIIVSHASTTLTSMSNVQLLHPWTECAATSWFLY